MKKKFRKFLLYLLKIIEMPQYSKQDVQLITRFLYNTFTVDVANVSVNFQSSNVSGIKDSIIELNYEIDTSAGFFYVYIKYSRASNNIELFSKGNQEMPFKELAKMSMKFGSVHFTFEEAKNEHLLPLLQRLP